MLIFQPSHLTEITASIFAAYGVPSDQAGIVARSLVKANLAGHDSHGVIRIKEYVEYLDRHDVEPRAELHVVKDAGPILQLAGNFGFGQVLGALAMERGIARAREHGFCLMGLNRSGHLGRIGEWPEMAVAAGLVSIHFVNTHGGGKIVAPFGGAERRMSANPFAAGVPVPGRPPVLIDISTSAIAGGKVHVAYNKGGSIADGCVIDRNGQVTTDPSDFMHGLGALLNFGGHKGYAVGFLCDILAGALTGAPCSHPDIKRVANAMFSVILDPAQFADPSAFYAEATRYIDYLKASPPRPGFDEVLYPGEPEARAEEYRSRNGIQLDATTWNEIAETGARFGLSWDLAKG